MSSKIWEKGIATEARIEAFTVGRDPEFDLLLAPYDILGSAAHVKMLNSCGLISKEDTQGVLEGLEALYKDVLAGNFSIEEGVEDIHSQVEMTLIRKLGEAGKKIHTARSRNDQVLVDIKMFLREKAVSLQRRASELSRILLSQADRYQDLPMPGYTHMQVAMPSSYGLWFSAWAESLLDDMDALEYALRISNRNPLGSGAGYGSSFPIDREMTTRLLGFDRPHANSVYAQMTRGKTEKRFAEAIAALASTIGKWAMDSTLYLGQNFSFFRLPDEMTTGSSIMPHKKNPDVFELIRAKCSRLQALPTELTLLTHNLPAGYHRDVQLTKEILFPAIAELESVLDMSAEMALALEPTPPELAAHPYGYIYSVDLIQDMMKQGVPFREAYQRIAGQIAEGNFNIPEKKETTHLGSPDNPGIGNIRNWLDEMERRFPQSFIDVDRLFSMT